MKGHILSYEFQLPYPKQVASPSFQNAGAHHSSACESPKGKITLKSQRLNLVI